MTTKTYRGDLTNEAGDHLGCIHATTEGFIVRKPDGRSIGPAIFGGKVFSGKDFALVRSTNLGYATVKTYKLREAA